MSVGVLRMPHCVAELHGIRIHVVYWCHRMQSRCILLKFHLRPCIRVSSLLSSPRCTLALHLLTALDSPHSPHMTSPRHHTVSRLGKRPAPVARLSPRHSFPQRLSPVVLPNRPYLPDRSDPSRLSLVQQTAVIARVSCIVGISGLTIYAPLFHIGSKSFSMCLLVLVGLGLQLWCNPSQLVSMVLIADALWCAHHSCSDIV
jgi:hypothetical protein